MNNKIKLLPNGYVYSSTIIDEYNIHRNTLVNWQKRGLPFKKIKGSNLKIYKWEDVVEFVEAT